MLRNLFLRAKTSLVYRLLIGRWVNQRYLNDPARVVNCLYRTAFGRRADPQGLADRIHQLQSGVPLEVMADQLVRSPEFQRRHGTSQIVDADFFSALFRDGLRRKPDRDGVARCVEARARGATRAEVLAALAASEEALQTWEPSPADPARLGDPSLLVNSLFRTAFGRDADAENLDARTAYNRWVAAYDKISEVDRTAIRVHIAGLPFRPVISVVMPIGGTSEAALRRSLNSVFKQLYPYWELCVASDRNAEPLASASLGRQMAHDPRIRVAQRVRGEGSAAAANAALDLATGEFVVFLRPGDLLSEHALYEVALAFGANPQTEIVYTDHDQIGAAGQRFSPWFKPGWDPDLLLAQDYISDLAAYRRTLVEEIGSLRPDIEGAEFHDLALRATSATTPDRVCHIPAVLYHALEIETPIHSENSPLRDRAIAASHRAVRGYLDSLGYKDAVLQAAPQIPGAIRVVWPLPEPPPLVSVVIPTRDRANLLARCVDGVLHRTEYKHLELLIVDNGSIEPTTHALFARLTDEDRRVRVLRRPGLFNYSALNNSAAREANGEILLLLNDDIDVIESGWLRELVSHALRPDVGIVGAKLLYADERVQHAGIVMGPDGYVTHLHRFAGKNEPGYCGQLALPRTLSAVTGACVAIRREVFFEVGGLDEVNLPVTFNDVDLCLRLGDHGYRVVWTPFAQLFHLESASRGPDDSPAKRGRSQREWRHLRRVWGSLLESADPYHNPNVLFHPHFHEIPSTPRRAKPWITSLGKYQA